MAALNRRRRIAVVTGSRADYGLLRGAMNHLKDDARVQLQTIVCGMHLAPQFGSTWRAVEQDGFTIDARVDLQLAGDTPVSTAKSIGLGTIGFADALAGLAPDIVVLPGDRYEVLAAGVAATVLNIPIAHIHGGEVTHGAFDDAIRHALTKMALVHFVAAEPYRRRVIQMGEDPDLVFNVGAPGLDALPAADLVDRETLFRDFGLPESRGFILVTLHPSTAQPKVDEPTVTALLTALDRLEGRSIVFTGVNADPGNSVIDAAIAAYVNRSRGRARLFTSLGSQRYLSALRFADAVVGNSSSGIIEAPAVGTPTVNIGERQAGRLRAATVVDCRPEADAIAAALQAVLKQDFRKRNDAQEPPYGRGGASRKIADVLAALDTARKWPKKFHDLTTEPS